MVAFAVRRTLVDHTRGNQGNARRATRRSRRSLAGLVGGLVAGGGVAALLGWPETAAKKHKKGHGGGGGGGTCPAACTSTSCGSFPTSCPLLPTDNIWHARVDRLPLDGN